VLPGRAPGPFIFKEPSKRKKKGGIASIVAHQKLTHKHSGAGKGGGDKHFCQGKERNKEYLVRGNWEGGRGGMYTESAGEGRDSVVYSSLEVKKKRPLTHRQGSTRHT